MEEARTESYAGNAPQEYFSFAVPVREVSPEKRKRNERDRFHESDQSQGKRIMRNSIEFIAYRDLLNHKRDGKEKRSRNEMAKFVIA